MIINKVFLALSYDMWLTDTSVRIIGVSATQDGAVTIAVGDNDAIKNVEQENGHIVIEEWHLEQPESNMHVLCSQNDKDLEVFLLERDKQYKAETFEMLSDLLDDTDYIDEINNYSDKKIIEHGLQDDEGNWLENEWNIDSHSEAVMQFGYDWIDEQIEAKRFIKLKREDGKEFYYIRR